LPAEIRRLADKVYAIWKNDPVHGSLHFKPIQGFEDLWSVRIGRQYRALCRRRGDLVV
jgi:Txe/YoeB family toxin of Txe-Axe toxin-antitoxin module